MLMLHRRRAEGGNACASKGVLKTTPGRSSCRYSTSSVHQTIGRGNRMGVNLRDPQNLINSADQLQSPSDVFSSLRSRPVKDSTACKPQGADRLAAKKMPSTIHTALEARVRAYR